MHGKDLRFKRCYFVVYHIYEGKTTIRTKGLQTIWGLVKQGEFVRKKSKKKLDKRGAHGYNKHVLFEPPV